jgi:hypothetical protein
MDRKHDAVLLTVGLDLPALANQPGVSSNPEQFLKKLSSLARLGLSAAAQKREFLRRRSKDCPQLLTGFLLGRARLIVAPVGLENVVRCLTGEGMCQDAGMKMGRRIVEHLLGVLRCDGLNYRLDTGLDAPCCLESPFNLPASAYVSDPRQIVGLTPWDQSASLKIQLQAAGALHSIAEAGTASIFPPLDPPNTAMDLAEALHWAWQHTGITRLGFVQPSPP